MPTHETKERILEFMRGMEKAHRDQFWASTDSDDRRIHERCADGWGYAAGLVLADIENDTKRTMDHALRREVFGDVAREKARCERG